MESDGGRVAVAVGGDSVSDGVLFNSGLDEMEGIVGVVFNLGLGV